MTWTGTDIFGRPLAAVVNKDGSIIVTRAADDEEEEDEGAVVSLNPDSVESLAQWIRQQATPPTPAPSGLRWGVRHKTTGKIVARFEWHSSAAVYLRRGHAADGWRPDDIELVDLAPEPTTAGSG